MTEVAHPTPQSRAHWKSAPGRAIRPPCCAELRKEVYSIEILEPLADDARRPVGQVGYKTVSVRCGDGYQGWRRTCRRST